MSEGENFLRRWSARKLANRTEPAPADTPGEPPPRDPPEQVDNAAIAETQNAADATENAATDPPLPSLDSIGADTDISAFLHRDVPPDLTRAALRRAWTSDPAIKDFVGLVENGWDFNDPSAMSGFGPISAEEVARLAGKVIEALPETAAVDQTKDASASEKKSRLVDAQGLPAEQCKLTPKAESGHDIDHDAAQQSEIKNES